MSKMPHTVLFDIFSFFFLHFFQSKKPRLCSVKGLRETELYPKRPWPSCSRPIQMKRFLSRDSYFFSQSIWEFWKPTTRNQRSYHVLFSKDIRSCRRLCSLSIMEVMMLVPSSSLPCTSHFTLCTHWIQMPVSLLFWMSSSFKTLSFRLWFFTLWPLTAISVPPWRLER